MVRIIALLAAGAGFLLIVVGGLSGERELAAAGFGLFLVGAIVALWKD